MTDFRSAIELAAARYRLGLESGESLRSLGEVLLADGHDEAVRLAIVENPVMADVGPLFEEVCAELGQSIPPLSEAVDLVATEILRGIVDGAIAPEVGLRELVDDVYSAIRDQDQPGGYAGESHGFQDLIGARWDTTTCGTGQANYRSTASSARPPSRCWMKTPEAMRANGWQIIDPARAACRSDRQRSR